MPSEQDIRSQFELLTLHRQNLRLFQKQHIAQGGAAFAEPVVQRGITEAVAGIAHCKAALRAWGISVEDLPDDEGPPGTLTAPLAQTRLAELPVGDMEPIPDPQTLPEPHRMPFSANPLFVGRTAALRTVGAQLKAGGTTVVTTGIGGMGKTQFAIEVAHRYGRFFGGGVFWLSFADPSGIASEVAACGRAMGLYNEGDELSQAEQVEHVKAAWTADLPRLLIFDNCEDQSLLRKWKPTTGACRVLVTSRRATWSPTLKVHTLPLDVLSRADSIALLRQHRPDLADQEAEAIADELGRLPLALHLAGSFLARYQQITPEAYLGRLRQPDLLTHPSLQGRGVEDMPTEREPHVARAFALSFDRLDPADPTDALAQRLLARAAYLAPGEPFPQKLLQPPGDLANEEALIATADALARLLNLGLLERADEGAFRLHRLIAAYTTQVLREQSELEVVENAIIAASNSAKAVPPILAHLQHAVQRAWKAERDDARAASLYRWLGNYLNRTGDYAQVQPLYERALTIRKKVLGEDHEFTRNLMNDLACWYKADGQYDKAQILFERVLEYRHQHFGSEDPSTAFSMHNLAALYHSRGLYSEARRLYERVLDIREQVLGSKHHRTARTLHNLATVYQDQGLYSEARHFYEQALAIREQVLGPDHQYMGGTLKHFASLCAITGHYDEAVSLFQRALTIHKQATRWVNPETASLLRQIGQLYYLQEQYSEALPHYQEALAMYERLRGRHHPKTASTLASLAELYQAQGQIAEALPLAQEALEIQERMLGPQHPVTAIALNILARLHTAQRQYDQAQQLCLRALQTLEEMLGPEHPDTARSLITLAAIHAAQGRPAEAIPLYERALAIFAGVFDAEHPDIARVRAHLERLRSLEP